MNKNSRKLTTSDWVVIIATIATIFIGTIIAISTTLYQQETKHMITILIRYLPYTLILGGMVTLLWRFTHIYLRNRLDSKIEDKHKYLEDEIKKTDKATENKFLESNNKFLESNKLDDIIIAKFYTLSEATEMTNKILDRKINYLNNNFINLVEGKKIENVPNFYPDNEKSLYEKLIKKINEPINEHKTTT